jgi:hypothetical protein
VVGFFSKNKNNINYKTMFRLIVYKFFYSILSFFFLIIILLYGNFMGDSNKNKKGDKVDNEVVTADGIGLDKNNNNKGKRYVSDIVVGLGNRSWLFLTSFGKSSFLVVKFVNFSFLSIFIFISFWVIFGFWKLLVFFIEIIFMSVFNVPYRWSLLFFSWFYSKFFRPFLFFLKNCFVSIFFVWNLRKVFFLFSFYVIFFLCEKNIDIPWWYGFQTPVYNLFEDPYDNGYDTEFWIGVGFYKEFFQNRLYVIDSFENISNFSNFDKKTTLVENFLFTDIQKNSFSATSPFAQYVEDFTYNIESTIYWQTWSISIMPETPHWVDWRTNMETVDYWDLRRTYSKGWLPYDDIIVILNENKFLELLKNVYGFLLYILFEKTPADALFVFYKYKLLGWLVENGQETFPFYFFSEKFFWFFFEFIYGISDVFLFKILASIKLSVAIFLEMVFEDFFGIVMRLNNLINWQSKTVDSFFPLSETIFELEYRLLNIEENSQFDDMLTWHESLEKISFDVEYEGFVENPSFFYYEDFSDDFFYDLGDSFFLNVDLDDVDEDDFQHYALLSYNFYKPFDFWMNDPSAMIFYRSPHYRDSHFFVKVYNLFEYLPLPLKADFFSNYYSFHPISSDILDTFDFYSSSLVTADFYEAFGIDRHNGRSYDFILGHGNFYLRSFFRNKYLNSFDYLNEEFNVDKSFDFNRKLKFFYNYYLEIPGFEIVLQNNIGFFPFDFSFMSRVGIPSLGNYTSEVNSVFPIYRGPMLEGDAGSRLENTSYFWLSFMLDETGKVTRSQVPYKNFSFYGDRMLGTFSYKGYPTDFYAYSSHSMLLIVLFRIFFVFYSVFLFFYNLIFEYTSFCIFFYFFVVFVIYLYQSFIVEMVIFSKEMLKFHKIFLKYNLVLKEKLSNESLNFKVEFLTIFFKRRLLFVFNFWRFAWIRIFKNAFHLFFLCFFSPLIYFFSLFYLRFKFKIFLFFVNLIGSSARFFYFLYVKIKVYFLFFCRKFWNTTKRIFFFGFFFFSFCFLVSYIIRIIIFFFKFVLGFFFFSFAYYLFFNFFEYAFDVFVDDKAYEDILLNKGENVDEKDSFFFYKYNYVFGWTDATWLSLVALVNFFFVLWFISLVSKTFCDNLLRHPFGESFSFLERSGIIDIEHTNENPHDVLEEFISDFHEVSGLGIASAGLGYNDDHDHHYRSVLTSSDLYDGGEDINFFFDAYTAFLQSKFYRRQNLISFLNEYFYLIPIGDHKEKKVDDKSLMVSVDGPDIFSLFLGEKDFSEISGPVTKEDLEFLWVYLELLLETKWLSKKKKVIKLRKLLEFLDKRDIVSVFVEGFRQEVFKNLFALGEQNEIFNEVGLISDEEKLKAQSLFYSFKSFLGLEKKKNKKSKYTYNSRYRSLFRKRGIFGRLGGLKYFFYLKRTILKKDTLRDDLSYFLPNKFFYWYIMKDLVVTIARYKFSGSLISKISNVLKNRKNFTTLNSDVLFNLYNFRASVVLGYYTEFLDCFNYENNVFFLQDSDLDMNWEEVDVLEEFDAFGGDLVLSDFHTDEVGDEFIFSPEFSEHDYSEKFLYTDSLFFKEEVFYKMVPKEFHKFWDSYSFSDKEMFEDSTWITDVVVDRFFFDVLKEDAIFPYDRFLISNFNAFSNFDFLDEDILSTRNAKLRDIYAIVYSRIPSTVFCNFSKLFFIRLSYPIFNEILESGPTGLLFGSDKMRELFIKGFKIRPNRKALFADFYKRKLNRYRVKRSGVFKKFKGKIKKSDYKINLRKLEELKSDIKNRLAEKIEVSWIEDNLDDVRAIDNRQKLSEKVLSDIYRKKMDVFMNITTFLSVFSKYRLKEISKKSLLPNKKEETLEEKLKRKEREEKSGEKKKEEKIQKLITDKRKHSMRFRQRKAFRVFKMISRKRRLTSSTLKETNKSSLNFFEIADLYNKLVYGKNMKNLSLLKKRSLLRKLVDIKRLWLASKNQELNLKIKKIDRKIAPLRYIRLLKKKRRYSYLKRRLFMYGTDKDIFSTVSRNRENSFDNLFFFVSYSPYNKKFMAELKKLFDFYTIAIKGTDLYDNKFKRKFFSNIDYYIELLDLKNFPQMNKEEMERLWAFLGCTKTEWFTSDKHEIRLVPQYNPWEFPLVLFLVIFFSYCTSVDSFWTFSLPDYGVLNMSQDELHEEGFNYYEKGNLGYQSYASGRFAEINPFDPHVWFDFLSFLRREYFVKIFNDFFSSWVFRNHYYFLNNFSSEFYKNYNMLFSKDILYRSVDLSLSVFFKDLFGFYGYLFNSLCSVFFVVTSFNISNFVVLDDNFFLVYLIVFLKIFFLSLVSFFGFFFTLTFVEKDFFFFFILMFFDFFLSFFYVYIYKLFFICFSINWGFVNYFIIWLEEIIEVIMLFVSSFDFYFFLNFFFDIERLDEKVVENLSKDMSFFTFVKIFFYLFFYLIKLFFY